MAAPSGNSSLLAGLGAFAVVVGGLAAYKHFTGAPAEQPQVATAIDEPDVVQVDAAPSHPRASINTFIADQLAPAFDLLGKSEAEVRAAFPNQTLRDDADPNAAFAGATMVAWSSFSDDDYVDAAIGFYLSNGNVSKIVCSVNRAADHNSASLVQQADSRWQPGALERSSAGLGLRYHSNDTSIFAKHQSQDNEWIFTATPSKDTHEGGLGLGHSYTGNCDVVGRAPHHLGASKAYSLGQSETTVLAIASRAEPDDSHEFYEDSLALFSGLRDVDLVLSTRDKKLQTMTYELTDQRAEEIKACWNRPALSLESETYWKVGNERYRLFGNTLEIARVERVQDLVAKLKAALNQPFSKIANEAARYRVVGVPDWALAMDVNQQAVDDVADDDVVSSFDVYLFFYGQPDQREHLLQDIERGTGLAKLVRNDNNVPMLRAQLGGAVFETEMYSATDVVLHVRPAARR